MFDIDLEVWKQFQEGFVGNNRLALIMLVTFVVVTVGSWLGLHFVFWLHKICTSTKS